MKKPFNLRALLALAVTLAMPAASHANTYTKVDNTNSLDQAASWGGTAPGSGDLANWAGAYSGGGSTNSLTTTVMPASALAWQGITIGALSGTALTTNSLNFAGSNMVSTITEGVNPVTGLANLVTVTTAPSHHGFVPLQTVTISGVTPAGYNGTFTVVGVPAANQFTYIANTTGLAAGSAFGLISGDFYIGGEGSATSGSALTIGTSGINLSAANLSVVVNAATINFSGNQTWTVPPGLNLRFGAAGVNNGADALFGTFSGSTINVSGGGVVDLNQSGTGFQNASANWIINSGTTVRNTRNDPQNWGNGSSTLTLNGGTATTGGPSGAVGNWMWNVPITLQTGTTSFFDEQNVTGSGRYLKLNSAIGGSGNLTILDTCAGGVSTFTSTDLGFILTGANNFSGTLTIGGPVENGIAGRLTPVRLGGTQASSTDTGTGAGNAGTLGTGNVVNNGVLTFLYEQGVSVPNNISGTGTLRIGSLSTTYIGAAYQGITLSGANTYTGPTIINAGDLVIDTAGAIADSASITITTNSVNGGAIVNTLDVSALANGYTVSPGQTLSLNGGQINGSLNFGAGSTNLLAPGGSNTIGTLSISGNLNLSGGNNTFVLDVNNSASDQISVGGNLTVSGITAIQVTPIALAPGLYPVITVGGTLGGSAANFTLTGVSAAGRGGSVSVVYPGNNTVAIQVAGNPSANLTWVGNNANNVWNTDITTNWFNTGTSALDFFYAGDFVTFADTAAGTTNVTLVGSLLPGSITLNNNLNNYTFGGSGQIGGGGALTMNGSGLLTINTANSFTGGSAINAGVVNAQKPGALGTGPVTVASGAALEVGGGIILGAGPMTLSGAGVNGASVLLGIGGTNTSGSTIALAAGSTIGVTTNQLTLSGVISDGGNNFGLAKTGNGTLTLGAINTFGGNLNISNGTVEVTAVRTGGYPSGLGNGFNTVNLYAGTTLIFDVNGSTYFHGPINNYGATITCDTINNVIAAANPLTFDVAPGSINGTGQAQLREVGNEVVVTAAASGSSFSVASLQLQGSEGLTVVPFVIARGAVASDLTISSPISQAGGTLGILKQGNGIMTLTGANTYLGQTEVSAGTLGLSGSIAGPVLFDSGATLSRSTTNTGAITIDNTLTVNAGGTVYLKLNKTGGSLSSDSVQGLSSVTYGGTLDVTNITSDGTPLALGDTVTLFPSTSYAGSFASFILPALPAGLTWDTSQLAVNGSLDVMAGTPVTSAPTFNPPAGSYYTGAQTVTISSATPPGATIYYTTNGSTPTSASPSGISPLTVTVPANTIETIKAYGQAPSSTASSIQSATYNTIIPSDLNLVLASTPTAFWPLSEPSGPTAFDLSGNELNGTYSGSGVTYGVTGLPVGSNTVVTLDGVNGNVSIPYSATLDPSGPFTVEGWFNPASVTASLICPVAFFNVNGGGPRSGWLIYESTAGWEFRTYNQNSTATAVDVTGGTPTVGQWNHVAAVWDGTYGYIYVNGVLQNTSGATTYAANGVWPFTIGERSDTGFPWPGSVGNVAFYGRALTAQEIQTHALNTPLINISSAGTNVVVSWVPGGGGLQAAPAVTGVYTNVSGATSPLTNAPTGGNQFYRVKF